MQIIPLILPQITKTPSAPEGGFVKLFTSEGWLKLVGSDKHLRDAVLDRTLQGIDPLLTGEIRETDTLLEALSKVRHALKLRPVDDDAEFRYIYGGAPDKVLFVVDKPDQTKQLTIQHRQGITRFWDYVGSREDMVIKPGEWAVEYWPEEGTLRAFEAHIREHYDPDFEAEPLTVKEKSYQGQIRSVRLGVGKPWNYTPFRLWTGDGLDLEDHSSYNQELTGSRNGSNRRLTFPRPYHAGTTRVYRNGARQVPGVDNDYIELPPHQIEFHFPLEEGENLVVDYKSPRY
jgi:hypothetical protein